MRCRAGSAAWRWRFDRRSLKLDQVMKTIFGLMFRVLMLLVGLVFMASLLLAALLLLAVWLVQALWARLTGQPVRPWTFRVNRQAMWNRFYRAPENGHPARRDSADVVDVEIKEIKPPEG